MKNEDINSCVYALIQYYDTFLLSQLYSNNERLLYSPN